MRRIFIIGVMIFACAQVEAQQIYQFSQYIFNDFLLNPAVAGSKPYFDAKAVNRNQWTGVQDAPRTFTLGVHGPIYKDQMGVGGYLYSDVAGPTRRSGFQVSYAYHLTIKEGIRLGLGASFGLIHFATDGGKITLNTPDDVALSDGFMSVIKPDASAGLHLYHEKWYFSFSTAQLLGGKLQFFDDFSGTDNQLERHFLASGAYRFNVWRELDVEPMAMVRYVPGVPVLFDPGARVIYQDRVWLGGSYRIDTETNADAASIMLGYMFQNHLMLSYSYDIGTSNISRFGDGAHELVLGIRFREGRAQRTAAPPVE
ncbi:MAG: type IX secretion system membrane protein PorP/SprF [Bacteroidota bacterium]